MNIKLLEVPKNRVFVTLLTGAFGVVLDKRVAPDDDSLVIDAQVTEVRVELTYPSGRRTRRWLQPNMIVEEEEDTL